MKKYLAVDIGGTAIKYALLRENTEIIEKGEIPSPKRSGTREEFFALLDSVISRYEGQYAGIAVSSPGILDSDKGIIHVIGAFPCLRECPMKDILEETYHVPASVENDGKCAALAEYWKGALQGYRDGAVVLIGTAIGGGLILDGKLRRGKDFFAGEFSGTCTDIYHPADKNHYWSELGTRGLIRLAAEKTGEDLSSMDGRMFFERIEAGDENCLAALKEYTDLMAMQIFNVNILLDLEMFAIGGGISAQPKLLESLKESIQGIRSVHPDLLAGTELPLPEVTVCRFRNDANLIGALYHLIYENTQGD